MADKKFELRYPSPQTAIDIFAGKWASDLCKVCSVLGTGQIDLFVDDERPRQAAEALGNKDGRSDRLRVLELGLRDAPSVWVGAWASLVASRH
jgi:hypothetical protein